MSPSARFRTSSSLLSSAFRKAGSASGPRSRRAFVARSRAGNDGLPSCSISFSIVGGGSAAASGPTPTRATTTAASRDARVVTVQTPGVLVASGRPTKAQGRTALGFLLQLLDPHVPDQDRLVVPAQVLEPDVPLPRTVLDRRCVRPVMPLDGLVELAQVNVLHHLAINGRLQVVAL